MYLFYSVISAKGINLKEANRNKWDFPGGSVIKNLPAKKRIWVQSLGWKDALEKEMATHSSILAWEIPWTEEPGRLQSMGSQESDTTEHLNDHQESSLEQRYTFLGPHTGVWPHQAFRLYDR